MPAQLASLIYVSVVIWLFRRDFRERPNVTPALWLPFFWVFINGSRFVSVWLGIFGLNIGGSSVEEGSPVDALSFFILIVGGIWVLYQRQVNWGEFMRQNRWVTVYFAYCLLSIAWSDYPFISLKRYFKLLGQPVMVLVLLTEPDPVESFTRLMKRCAYLLIPISILFIKYYPQWGRGFETWSGMAMNTGITTSKNGLGLDCFVFGLFFIWHFLRVRRREKGVARKNELILCLIFLGLIGWLLYMAHSSTAVGSLIIALAMMFFVSLKFLDRRHIGSYLVVLVILFVLGDWLFGIYDLAIQSLGRNSTLTDRTIIWHTLLNWDINPILGVGFESFWLGERPEKISSMFSFEVNEAHNGYLETYIQLGLIGVCLTLAMLLAAFFKSQRALLSGFEFGRFRLAYLAGFIAYNWTEAAFRTHCLPFFLFFLIAIEYPRPIFEPASAVAHSFEVGDELVSPGERNSLHKPVQI